MDHLPLTFDLRGKSVLLVGRGEAAAAKERLLQSAGARIVDEPADDVRLAFVALDDPAEAESAAARLKAQGLLVNVVDRPALCDFTVPAIVDRSPVVIAVATGGASASLAKALRERFEALLPARLGVLAQAIARARATLAVRRTTVADRRLFWDALLAPGGVLDPLDEVADPDTAIAQAIDAAPAPRDAFAVIMLAGPDPDDMTLRQLRLLNQADVVLHTADVPQAVLDRARRDATRMVSAVPPTEPPPGRVVFVRLGAPSDPLL